MRTGRGSKELDTGLLPRKVGEKRQRALCSHFAGHWAHIACSPISWAVLGGCPPRGMEWILAPTLGFQTQCAGQVLRLPLAGWLGCLWGQQPEAEGPGLPAQKGAPRTYSPPCQEGPWGTSSVT